MKKYLWFKVDGNWYRSEPFVNGLYIRLKPTVRTPITLEAAEYFAHALRCCIKLTDNETTECTCRFWPSINRPCDWCKIINGD